jgi:RNA polymerase sigma-70 factor (ECF subfamily)
MSVHLAAAAPGAGPADPLRPTAAPPRGPCPFAEAMLAATPALTAFAMSLARRRDRAEDLVQETLLKAWARRDAFTLGSNMRAWLFTILRNLFYSQMRAAGREVADVDGALAERLAVGPAHDGRMELAEVRRAVEGLPADQRSALLMIAVAGLSYEAAAAASGCAVGTIKSRVSRARARIASELEGDPAIAAAAS